MECTSGTSKEHKPNNNTNPTGGGKSAGESENIMNKIRRKNLAEIIERLETLKSDLEDLASDLETLKDEEEEYMENIPENLQGGEKYERAEAAFDALDGAVSDLEDIDIEAIIDQINEAIDA